MSDAKWSCFPEDAFQKIRAIAHEHCRTEHPTMFSDAHHELSCSIARIEIEATEALRECLSAEPAPESTPAAKPEDHTLTEPWGYDIEACNKDGHGLCYLCPICLLHMTRAEARHHRCEGERAPDSSAPNGGDEDSGAPLLPSGWIATVTEPDTPGKGGRG